MTASAGTQPSSLSAVEPEPPAMAEGASKSGSVVRVAAWHDGQLTDTEGLPAVAEARAIPNALLWVDVADPDPPTVQEIARLLGLHPLIAKDIMEGNQRAKTEVTDAPAHTVPLSPSTLPPHP